MYMDMGTGKAPSPTPTSRSTDTGVTSRFCADLLEGGMEASAELNKPIRPLWICDSVLEVWEAKPEK